MSIPLDQKFHTIAANVPTVERGSALVNSQKEIFTMQDVADTVRPYKVFTALLTQSGGDDPHIQYIGTDYGSTLTIGVTYTIESNDTTDFTNVGAPNNDVGTYFIATGTTPANQNDNGNTSVIYNLGAPVATVLENTIGNVWFSYTDIGIYSCNSVDLFGLKTFTLAGTRDGYTCNSDGENQFFKSGESQIVILTFNDVSSLEDGNLYNTSIEIRVYE